jgi:MFS transporter, Spinster family, sphingosine-1-phosphate transporter
MGFTLLIALLAIGLMSANAPNWYALIAEINPPEHRGTAFSFGNLVNGIGRTIGTDLTVRTFEALARALPPPMNYAVGLAVFQLFFIPTGIMYWLAARTSARDIATVNLMMRRRVRAAVSAPPTAPPTASPPTTATDNASPGGR